MDERLIERFWSKVDVRGPDDCWEWQERSRHEYGYGILANAGGERRAHRISWEIHHGTPPGSLHVLHKCDNPPCVNPSHLFLGTPRDNVRDMHKKGRRVYKTTLSDDDAEIVRIMYHERRMTQKEIARKFGVSSALVSNIVKEQGGAKRFRLRKRLSEKECIEIAAAFLNGESVNDLLNKYSVSHMTIRRAIEQYKEQVK